MADGGDAGKKLFMPSEACPISPEPTRTGSSQGWPKANVCKSSVSFLYLSPKQQLILTHFFFVSIITRL